MLADSLLLPDWEKRRLTPEEQSQVAVAMANPAIKRYFQTLMQTALEDIAANEAETVEQKEKFLARFQKLKGVLYVCTLALTFKEIPKQ